MPNNELSSFSQDDYNVTQRDLLYKGVFSLQRYHLKHRLFKGGWSQKFTREVFERPSAAAILPYDPVNDRVVLIEQFRAGAISRATPWVLEVVAGIYHEDEKPEQVARRESQEEAGCDITDIHPVCDFFVSPGGSNEYLHLFVGRIDTSDIDGLYGLPEENEDIRAITFSSAEAFQLLKDCKIKTSPAIIALQWLQINREWLRELWQIK